MITADDLLYAKNLKILRKSAGWKQLMAADKVGLSSQQEYSKLESGKMHFTEEMLQKIREVFRLNDSHFKSLVNQKYKFDWRDYIKEGKVNDFIELMNNRGLIAILLGSEKRAIELELELIERRLKELMPPNYDDTNEDKSLEI